MAPETRRQATHKAGSMAALPVALPAHPPRLSTNGVHHERAADDTISIRSRRSARSSPPDEPPRFVIDLSLPPEQRYLELCAAFKSEMLNLTSLFDEVVGDMVRFLPVKWLRICSKLFLRRVHDSEENAELKGISKATGVDMYLLVCFNVLLDLFMGCSSGGAMVRAGAGLQGGSKMVHFRTLDWGMDKLRRVVVQLDYTTERDGPILASSITYAGFVGVLTGVRKELSMSLNFRPNRIDNGKFWSDVKYGWHLLMVLLGKRPSISSNLRHFLLPRRKMKKAVSWLSFNNASETVVPTYSDIITKIARADGKSRPIITTACYLCFSNGKETTVVEKDRISAKARSSTAFIVITNGDDDANDHAGDKKREDAVFDATMQEIVQEAQDRQQCAHNNWSNMRFAKLKQIGLDANYNGEDLMSLMEVSDVVEMTQMYPTTNECTHFACVMDPAEGTISWCRRWMRPVSAKWIREHMSDTW